MHVVLVCKSGGDYGPRSVARLQKQIDLPIIVLTDFDEDCFDGVEVRPLRHNWPGWWSKIEFFREDLHYLDCLYLDLDVVVVDSLEDMGRDGFAMWVDPFGHGFNSSVMYKPREAGTRHLYEDFKETPAKFMQEFSVGNGTKNGLMWGDQGYITKYGRTSGRNYRAPEVCSFKKDGQEEDCKVLVFHGQPKPYEAGYE